MQSWIASSDSHALPYIQCVPYKAAAPAGPPASLLLLSFHFFSFSLPQLIPQPEAAGSLTQYVWICVPFYVSLALPLCNLSLSRVGPVYVKQQAVPLIAYKLWISFPMCFYCEFDVLFLSLSLVHKCQCFKFSCTRLDLVSIRRLYSFSIRTNNMS